MRSRRVVLGARVLGLLVLTTTALVASASSAQTTPIDLNAFGGDPEVTIAADGRSAQLVEVEVATFVRRTNDPYVGDPVVIVASADNALTFDFDFVEAAGAQDEFSVLLFEAGPTGGPYLGALERFTVQSTQTGTAQIDLRPYAGRELGLELELLDVGASGVVGSTATIANLALEVVPEPSLTAMLAVGVAGLLFASRRNAARPGR